MVVIVVTHQQALGMREAIRPLASPSTSPLDASYLILLHEKILGALVAFDTTPRETVELTITREDVLYINQFLSMQDGDWAADVLKQARRALYELRNGVLPGYKEDTAKLWEGTTSERPSDE